MASKAPKTLKRFRPAGALIKIRRKDHRYPRNAAKTKWAASTKNTLRFPALASFRAAARCDQLWYWSARALGVAAVNRNREDILGILSRIGNLQEVLANKAAHMYYM
jgi:hypothetical protein